MSTDRQDLALRLVRAADRTSLQDLATRLGVSQMTVRRDLDELERQGLVQRVRGGAVPLHPRLHAARGAGADSRGADDQTLTEHGPTRRAPGDHAPAGQLLLQPAPEPRQRAQAQDRAQDQDRGRRRGEADAVERIGQAVASSLSPGSTVLLDAGPLATAVAAHLPGRAPLTVAVLGLPAALALVDSPGITLLVLGGRAHGGDRALDGPLALAALGVLDVDVLVTSTVTGNTGAGWSTSSLEAAEVLRTAMGRAERTVVAARAGALGVRSLARVAPLGAVSAVVTDAGVHDDGTAPRAGEVLRALAAAAVPVTVV